MCVSLQGGGRGLSTSHPAQLTHLKPTAWAEGWHKVKHKTGNVPLSPAWASVAAAVLSWGQSEVMGHKKTTRSDKCELPLSVSRLPYPRGEGGRSSGDTP